jgi:hypothetical protein
MTLRERRSFSGARPRPAGGTPTGVLAVAVVGAACGADPSPRQHAEWVAQIDTVGDTIVVRTVSGSEWGVRELVPDVRIGSLEGEEHEMFGQIQMLATDPRDGSVYIYDRQVPALRKYDAEGRYLATFGGKGGGPGEYENADSGLGVLSDGRVVLRDPGNARFTVYAADGRYLESWPARGGMFTASPIIVSGDGFYNPVFQFTGEWTGSRLVRHDAAGLAGDTLVPPEMGGHVTPSITARTENATQTWNVPFAAAVTRAFHSDGYHVGAITDRYQVDLFRPDGTVLRLGREVEPVPVSSGERAAEEERVTTAMRRLDPSWRWSGPPIPQSKPIIAGITPGSDGRIWVQLHQPGERVPDDELEPGPDGRRPPARFRERVVWDVFEPDGRFLGQVVAPEGFSASPRPVLERDRVWGVMSDDLGVQYLTRFRFDDIEPSG